MISRGKAGNTRPKGEESLKDKGLKINKEKTKVICESFGTGTTGYR